MNLVSSRSTLALGFGATLAGLASFVSPPAAQAEFEVHPVAGRIHMVEGAGGNIGVWSGENGLLVIDTQLANAREQVLDTVLDVGPGPVRYLLNTHWHGDHVGNNAQVAGGAPILAHANVRRRMAGDPTIDGRKDENTPAGALPALTWEEGIELHVEGELVRVRHFANAHTDGDSVVFFPDSKVVHTGDIVFNGRFPFIDVESGGSVQGVLAAVDALLPLVDGWKIIPGHGPIASHADLVAYRSMLATCADRVKAAIADGKGPLEMRDAGLIDDYAKDWAWGFIDSGRFLDLLYASLTR